MRKKLSLIPALVVILWIITDLTSYHAVSNNMGAPAGHTGSTFDNKTCAKSGCHTGTATMLPGIISSNVPPGGYIPGSTYTITCTCTQAGINKWGFQVSPMNNAGALIGSLLITSPSTTKITATKYVTHTSGGTAGPGTKSWSFNWVAPVSGTGSVTFYGAFNYANGNSNSSGDIIHTSSLIISENTTGIAENSKETDHLKVIQNPFSERLTVQYKKEHAGETNFYIYNVEGKIFKKLEIGLKSPGLYSEEVFNTSSWPQGTYILIYIDGETMLTDKLAKF